MGQAIERMAKDRGHEIGYINNGESIDLEAVKATDVAIEFTQPDAALKTITSILSTGTPVIAEQQAGWIRKVKPMRLLKRTKRLSSMHLIFRSVSIVFRYQRKAIGPDEGP